MHLEAMLVFVNGLGHQLELARLVELRCCLAVDCEFPEWSSIMCAFGQSCFGKIVVV